MLFDFTLVGKWSQMEDELLFKGVEKVGRKWFKISLEYVKTRSPAACIKRYQQLLQNNKN